MLLGAQLDPQEIDELMEEADVVCTTLMTMIVIVTVMVMFMVMVVFAVMVMVMASAGTDFICLRTAMGSFIFIFFRTAMGSWTMGNS